MTTFPKSPEYPHVTEFVPTGITHFKSQSHPWKLRKQFIHTWISHRHGGSHFILLFIPFAHDRICHWRIQRSVTASTCALAMASAWSWGQSASPILRPVPVIGWNFGQLRPPYDHWETSQYKTAASTLERWNSWFEILQTSSNRRALCIRPSLVLVLDPVKI